MASSATTTSSNSDSDSNKPPLFCLVDTETTVLQKQAEKECQPYFVDLSKLPADQKAHLRRIGLLQERDESGKPENDDVQLLRDKHRRYLEGVWKRPLKAPFVSLDSSRPWMLYWCLHGYDLLSTLAPSDSIGSETETEPTHWFTSSEGSSMVSTLEDCWQGYHTRFSEIPEIIANDGDDDEDDDIYFALHEDDEHRSDSDKDNEEAQYYCGGFGGGPSQQAHAATTYAAVLALCILATSGPGKSKNNTDNGNGKTTNSNSNSDTNKSETNNDDDGDDDDDDDSENSSYSSLHYSDRARRILSEIRIPLYRWMVSLQVPSTGGYRMQHDGEVDVRATYTIACCSKLLGLLETPTNTKTNTASTTNPTTTKKTFTALGRPLVIDFVKSCQTYEGGMGGEPFSEAHGGYTFCAVAALKLLGALNNSNNRSNSSHGFDVSTLLGWLGRRQLSYEGGFSGRSNKLVDGCYSFWQGGAMAIASSCSECLAGEEDEESGSEDRDGANDPWLARYRQQTNPAINLPTDAASTSTTNNPDDSDTNNNSPPNLPFPLLYDVFLLERYILLCAQEVTGGLRDKPSKPRDFYHTCYNLSGLSIAQHSSSSMSPASDDENETEKVGFGDPKQTLVGQTHPCYNLRIDRVAAILEIDWGE